MSDDDLVVVEDDALIALDTEQTLAGLGCSVLGPAPSVSRALALLEDNAPDFALLDVNLGAETSTPVAVELRKRRVPFAYLTAYDRARLPEPPLHNVELLQKPVHRGELRLLLSTKMARRGCCW